MALPGDIWAHIPWVDSISSTASVETINTWSENLEFYEERNYSYVPIPFSGQYYDVDEGELIAIDDEQWVPGDSGIIELLPKLTEHPFLIFRTPTIDEKLAIQEFEEQTGNSVDSQGSYPTLQLASKQYPEEKKLLAEIADSHDYYQIVTLADINKRGVREALYPIIAGVETAMANEIEKKYETTESQRELFDDVGDGTIGAWERAGYEGIQMNISEHMYLSEILKVVGKDEELRQEFGFSSRNKLKNQLGGLNNLRNQVMHPTRTLVHDRSDLEKVIGRVSRGVDILREYGGKVQTANYDEPDYARFSDK